MSTVPLIDLGSIYAYASEVMRECLTSSNKNPIIPKNVLDEVNALFKDAVTVVKFERGDHTSPIPCEYVAYSLVADTIRESHKVGFTWGQREELYSKIESFANTLEDIAKGNTLTYNSEDCAMLQKFFTHLAQKSEERAYASWASGRKSKYSY